MKLAAIALIMIGAWATAQAQAPLTSRTEIGSTKIAETASPEDQAYMRAWSITTEELGRYRALMKGPRGALSVANISPLEVLGIHAETPAERRRYAQRWVRMMQEDTERVLAFERAVQDAWQRSGGAMFDPARLPVRQSVNTQAEALRGQRLAVFIAENDCSACPYELRRLASMVGPTLVGLDVYVVDTDNDDAIRQIARDAGIAKADVAARRITINRGKTLYATMNGAPLPAVFFRSGKTLRPIGQLLENMR